MECKHLGTKNSRFISPTQVFSGDFFRSFPLLNKKVRLAELVIAYRWHQVIKSFLFWYTTTTPPTKKNKQTGLSQYKISPKHIWWPQRSRGRDLEDDYRIYRAISIVCVCKGLLLSFLPAHFQCKQITIKINWKILNAFQPISKQLPGRTRSRFTWPQGKHIHNINKTNHVRASCIQSTADLVGGFNPIEK